MSNLLQSERVLMGIDATLFKETLSHWASGVTVVTSMAETEPVGITASSFSSVSLEPPQVLICVVKRLYTHQVIQNSGAFAVNILSVEQLDWGKRFAGMFPEIEDRFQGIDYSTAETGSPLLPDVLAWLDCRVVHAYDGGDHTVYIGQVLAAKSAPIGNPLLYYHRNWRQLGEHGPA